MANFGVPDKGKHNWTDIPNPQHNSELNGRWEANLTPNNKVTDVWVEANGHKYDIHNTSKGTTFFVDGKPFSAMPAEQQQTALTVMRAVYDAPDFKNEKGEIAYDRPSLPTTSASAPVAAPATSDQTSRLVPVATGRRSQAPMAAEVVTPTAATASSGITVIKSSGETVACSPAGFAVVNSHGGYMETADTLPSGKPYMKREKIGAGLTDEPMDANQQHAKESAMASGCKPPQDAPMVQNPAQDLRNIANKQWASLKP